MDDPRIDISCDGPDGMVTASIAITGGGIRLLRHGTYDVIPHDNVFAREERASGATLAPWPNRLRDGVWRDGDREMQLTRNDPRGHAIHGLVYHRRFDVVDQQRDSLSLQCNLGDDAGYPFAATVGVEYRVHASGLDCTLHARNNAQRRIPMALGAHPYFPWTIGTTLTINAGTILENDDRLIPTGRTHPASTVGLISHQPIGIESLQLDDCLTDLARDSAGIAHAILRRPDGHVTSMWQDGTLPYTQVFVTREPLWETDTSFAIALEPQMCPANAFNTGVDLPWLDPGEELIARWGVQHSVER